MKENRQFVTDEVKKLGESFKGVPAGEVFRFISARLLEVSRLAGSYKKRFDKLTSTGSIPLDVVELKAFKKQVFDLLTKAREKTEPEDFATIFSDYHSELDEMTGGLKKTVRRRVRFSRYSFRRNDHPIAWFKKFALNSGYSIRSAFIALGNLLRKLFGKPPKSTEVYVIRRIPYQAMVRYYLGNRFAELALVSVQHTMQGKSKTLQELWRFDEKLDMALQSALAVERSEDQDKLPTAEEAGKVFVELELMIEDLRKNLRSEVEKAETVAMAELDAAMQKVSTPELPPTRFQPSRLTAYRAEMEVAYAQELTGWNNTYSTLFDDWNVDVEISLLYFSVLVHFNGLKEKVNDFITAHLSLDFGQLKNFVSESVKRIEADSKSAKNIDKALEAERKKVNEILIDQLLAGTIEKLTGNLTDDLDVFKNRTMELAGKVSDKRGFVKSKNYERAIRSGEINWISPRELLGFEALPHFTQSINSVRKYVDERMDKARVKLLAMGTVSDFSLESAKMLLGEKKGAVKTTVKIAAEGYERALAHLEEASGLIDQIRYEPLSQLHKAIHEFNLEIQKLKNTDNIFDLNLRIARIRAVERSKKARKEIAGWIRQSGPRSARYLREHWSKLFGFLDEMKSRMGISQEKQQISYELSEFLSQTETALRRLPFVYQRLYQLTPTDEDRFFVNRKNELEILREAFEDWQKDRFVTTAIIGEKGSGVTSFINFFLRKIETDLPVVHFAPDHKIYTQDHYLKLFAELLGQEKFESNDGLIRYLSTADGYRIIIIENLHHFFLRQVHGFECQRMIFDLMANTSKKVFWIASYTTHSWEYLEKTLHISDHFVREIRLERLGDATIEEIIFKRNSLSGYKIIFEPSEANRESKAFMRMNSFEQQQFLRQQFFMALNRISNGNISLAQLYWLRSTMGVSDDTIRIEALREIDVSFVKDITTDYLFTLYAMLVHDGMSLHDYAGVFNKSESNVRNILVPMFEKGLLIKPKEKYNINPIIFRQVVNLLRSRNFIN